MEPLIKINDFFLKKIQKMLAADETVLAAIPCGNARYEDGRPAMSSERDFFVITNTRILDIKSKFLKTNVGFKAYPRRLLAECTCQNYNIGSTFILVFRDEADDSRQFTLEFQNCKRNEAEIIERELAASTGKKRCPQCCNLLDKDYSYCPKCRAELKRVCKACGKLFSVLEPSCPGCK